jgi:tetratricopeptide (TPR) repeat protein
MQYLDDAIQASRDVLKLNCLTDRPKLYLLNLLGMRVLKRFNRTGQPPDIGLAIQCFTQAMDKAPPSSRDKSIIMVNLSNAYRSQYTIRPVKEELKKPLDLIKEAYLVNPASFSHNSWLGAANEHLTHFRLSKDLLELASATESLKKALDAIPEEGDSTEHLVFFAGGHIFSEWYTCNTSQENMDFAIAYYLACWECSTATPIYRINAARSAANLLSNAGNVLEAWNLLREAVDLIPIACPRGLRGEDQQFITSQLSGLSNEACSAALAAGLPVLDALEILERGRGIIIAAAHGAASQLGDLEIKSPELYREFDRLQRQINTGSVEMQDLPFGGEGDGFTTPFWNVGGPPSSLYGGITPREHQVSQIERVIQRIRNEVPGLEVFLVPMSKSRIQSLAQEGPIVALVAGKTRADAILLFGTETRVLPLILPDGPRVYLQKMAILMTRLCVSNAEPLHVRNPLLRGCLVHLWKHVCGPICQALKLEPNCRDSRGLPRRIWWIATGLFARLPLHAAGIYVDKCDDTVPQRVVSSYIVSFRMLQFARSQSRNLNKHELRGMLISMSKAAGAPDPSQIFIGTAVEEAKGIKSESGRIQ